MFNSRQYENQCALEASLNKTNFPLTLVMCNVIKEKCHCSMRIVGVAVICTLHVPGVLQVVLYKLRIEYYHYFKALTVLTNSLTLDSNNVGMT